MRRVLVLLVCIAVVSVTLLAQKPANPSFEVASIKRNTGTDTMSTSGFQPGGRFQMINTNIARMIRLAHTRDVTQIIGLPGWTETERYDVLAIAALKNLTPADMQPLLRALLVERFKFAAHYETREQDVYAMVLARTDGRLGSQIRLATRDCAAIVRTIWAAGKAYIPDAADPRPPCGQRVNPNGLHEYGDASLADFAESMSGLAGRRVIDRTGLTGRYEITLRLTPWQSPDQQPVEQVSVFTALQEQLGFRLVSDRAPLKVIVIDHIERPTEN
jgi:uncharacterized protein (TIGR03435 family)